jgi:phosphatidylglycerol:prolipoprotein diacylglycerol transferase
VAEHLQMFVLHPYDTFFSSGGFNFYGGLVFGSLTYLYLCHKKGMKLVHLADIGSPGMMLAYTIGRLGCHLSGDGDWGIMNFHAKPAWVPQWVWSFTFPHNVINAGQPIPGCFGNHCMELTNGVYPTSFYEFGICLIIFMLMWIFRRKIVIPGLMFCIYLITGGTERLLMEMIRITDRHWFLGIRYTQAQLIGALFIIGGISGLIYIITKPYKLSKPIN